MALQEEPPAGKRLTHRKVRRAKAAEIIAHLHLLCLQENSASSNAELIIVHRNEKHVVTLSGSRNSTYAAQVKGSVLLIRRYGARTLGYDTELCFMQKLPESIFGLLCFC